ncbi:MAG: hypothetical protein Rhims3KO_36220 [Hyphomicrobiales bacterium]
MEPALDKPSRQSPGHVRSMGQERLWLYAGAVAVKAEGAVHLFCQRNTGIGIIRE